ncbi:hypothetical protein QTN47_06900 [Danxiaibacter flavus]|uniref:Uncharacterized protein n=1 Tax=Danxiaibacter flavus TaxID=3049108 RepID=A0ABV3ZCB0_9BACT|nr:hypothetical protein QNM32_06900 [Chitinophagaceae bacterium DXS]
MVQTDISQLTKECNQWREHLHSYRDEFNFLSSRLRQIASKALSHQQRSDLEHYQNQLHIQLINIHDLKQQVKLHERKINYEQSELKGISEETFTEHESLLDEYESQEHTLHDLRNNFDRYSISLNT